MCMQEVLCYNKGWLSADILQFWGVKGSEAEFVSN